jgi:hypothetical protein
VRCLAKDDDSEEKLPAAADVCSRCCSGSGLRSAQGGSSCAGSHCSPAVDVAAAVEHVQREPINPFSLIYFFSNKFQSSGFENTNHSLT